MDAQLVARAQRGDKEAFAMLADAMSQRLLATSHRILRDIDLAEDATQQALLGIWRDLPRLRDLERFEAWSYRILVRACYAEGRRERRWGPAPRLATLGDPRSGRPLEQVADRDQLERGFRRLSLNHRTVLVLHHYLGLSVDEISETLAIPTGTVASRMHYALRALRASLDADARRDTREVAQ